MTVDHYRARNQAIVLRDRYSLSGEAGFMAYLPELPTVIGHGDTRDKAIADLRAALRAALRVMREQRKPPLAALHRAS